MVDTGSNSDLHKRLADMVEAMPPFSGSVHRVMAMTADINCSPRDLVKVIESDPILTMKILRLLNSAFFSLSRRVASVQHALAYLGLNTVKNLTISIATVNSLPRKSIPELPMPAFLTHSLATATVAQRLAKDFLHLRDVSDHFVAGLLHDFGKVVFVQFDPATYAKILNEAREKQAPLPQVEMERMGVTCAETGAVLAETWKLPEMLIDCIRTHMDCDEESSDLTFTVAAANIIVKSMGIGNSGDPFIGDFQGFMCARLGMSLEEIVAKMKSLPDEVQDMQNMVQG